MKPSACLVEDLLELRVDSVHRGECACVLSVCVCTCVLCKQKEKIGEREKRGKKANKLYRNEWMSRALRLEATCEWIGAIEMRWYDWVDEQFWETKEQEVIGLATRPTNGASGWTHGRLPALSLEEGVKNKMKTIPISFCRFQRTTQYVFESSILYRQ